MTTREQTPFDRLLAEHDAMQRAIRQAQATAEPERVPEPDAPRWSDVGPSAGWGQSDELRRVFRTACPSCHDPLCTGDCLPEGQQYPCKHCGETAVELPNTACQPCVSTLHRDKRGQVVYGAKEKGHAA